MAIWSLAPSTRKLNIVEPTPNYSGGLIIKRVLEISALEAINMSVHFAQFTRAIVEYVTTKKDKLGMEYDNLLVKYGRLEQYNMQL